MGHPARQAPGRGEPDTRLVHVSWRDGDPVAVAEHEAAARKEAPPEPKAQTLFGGEAEAGVQGQVGGGSESQATEARSGLDQESTCREDGPSRAPSGAGIEEEEGIL